LGIPICSVCRLFPSRSSDTRHELAITTSARLSAYVEEETLSLLQACNPTLNPSEEVTPCYTWDLKIKCILQTIRPRTLYFRSRRFSVGSSFSKYSSKPKGMAKQVKSFMTNPNYFVEF
uniref:Tick transposon n=1 Tax=Haemonchus placei TaxID=6290 RepID=A0A0N4WNH6_HAEPC